MKIKYTLNVRKNIALKKTFRKKRSKLKKLLENDAIIDPIILAKYRLKDYVPYSIRKNKNLSPDEFIQPKKWETLTIPENFCFINDHTETVKFLKRLNSLILRKKPANFKINHKNTKKIGLSASFYFDKKITEYVEKWKKLNYIIGLKGEISQNKDVNNFLLSFGLLKTLGITVQDHGQSTTLFDLDYETKYETFKFEGSNREEYLNSKACTGLVDYFDTCFKYSNYEIKNEPYEDLVKAFGEIIGNAEEHCGKEHERWYVIGCYNKTNKSCSFSIINFGNTIYQNLSNEKATSSDVLENISKVIQSNVNYLQKIKQGTLRNVEHIYNFMALQDGISSKRTLANKGSTRGQGLMDVLQFIQSIKSDQDKAEIAIISGKSKILMDFTYPIKKVKVGPNNEERRQIFFNSENDLHKPQDPTKVIAMYDEFPGTILTGTFTINSKHLKNLR